VSQPVPAAPAEEQRVGAAAPRSSARNAALVGTGILLSRLTGLLRNALQARYLGAGVAADALVAATKIPNILQNLFGEGALSASFIPVYSRLRARGDDEAASRVAASVATLLALAVTVLVAFGVLAAPLLVRALEWGFTGERYELAVHLTRIIFPGTGLLVLAAWTLGVLNSHRRFLLPYAAPVAMNAVLVGALLWFGPRESVNGLVERLAWATVAGALLQLLVQLPSALRLVGSFRAGLGAGDPDVALVRRNFLPALVSRGVLQISSYIDMGIATLLPHGMVAIQFFASTIYMLPVSLFGMSIAASELPELSDDAGDGEEALRRVRARLETALQRVAFFIIPSAVAFVTLGDVIIGLLLRGGRFQANETLLTWGMLGGSAVGLLAATMGRLYSSTFFAFHDTRTPQRFAILRVALGSVLGAFAALALPQMLGIRREWGGVGLALAGSMAGWVEYAGLRSRLHGRIGRARLPRGRLPRLLVAAVASAAVAVAVKLVTLDLSRFVSGPLVLASYGIFYGASTYALGVPEAVGTVARVTGLVRRR
jgi:putative peptidoglycan lipid II flippase